MLAYHVVYAVRIWLRESFTSFKCEHVRVCPFLSCVNVRVFILPCDVRVPLINKDSITAY